MKLAYFVPNRDKVLDLIRKTLIILLIQYIIPLTNLRNIIYKIHIYNGYLLILTLTQFFEH